MAKGHDKPYGSFPKPERPLLKMNFKAAVFGIVLSWVALLIYSVSAEECTKATECTCSFYDGTTNFEGAGSDSRSIGLAAATGALSSMVLAGGGIALWKFFKGRGGDMGDAYGRPPSSQGSWMDERRESGPPRRGSYPNTDDYDNSGRLTAVSGKSNPTNIYRHGKVWPGSR